MQFSHCFLLVFIFLSFSILPISLTCCSGCNCNKPDCSINKYKCVDESPLCARLEPLCENFLFFQWKEMRCACPKTCKLCSENNVSVPVPIVPQQMQARIRCEARKNPIDVVFVLDGSSSITQTVFDNHVLGFVKNFASDLSVSENWHRLGVVQYGAYARNEFTLGQYNDTNALITAIDSIPYMMGDDTRTGMGIRRARSMFVSNRRRSTKACIVLTDGVSTDNVENQSHELRRIGVNVVAIGVGPYYRRAELELIAGNSSNVFTVNSFQDLNNVLAGQLSTLVCSDAAVNL